WLQVLDEAALASIADELREGGILGPIHGFPSVGGVDFTHAGAEVWHRSRDLRDPNRTPYAFTDVVHSKTARYFRTMSAALRAIDEVRQYDGDVTVAGPYAIGPWRAQWWRRFPEGYRIDME